MTPDLELEIALTAMSDRVADDKYGYSKAGSPEWKATKEAELQRLKADYEANGDSSEVAARIKRVNSRQSK